LEKFVNKTKRIIIGALIAVATAGAVAGVVESSAGASTVQAGTYHYESGTYHYE
jgi:F0F1-type ATP synthase membrane subunit c/vacuolar-type H+-ATPase subunit K